MLFFFFVVPFQLNVIPKIQVHNVVRKTKESTTGKKRNQTIKDLSIVKNNSKY